MKINWQTVTRLNEYDWLFTSFFLFLVAAAIVVAIVRSDKTATLGRSHYFLRMLVLTAVGYGVTAFVTIDPFHIVGGAYFLVDLDFLATDFGFFTLWKVCVVIAYYLQTRWTVCRIRDIGRFSIWWALLMALPTVSLIPTLIFALIPPRESEPPERHFNDSGDEEPVPLFGAS